MSSGQNKEKRRLGGAGPKYRSACCQVRGCQSNCKIFLPVTEEIREYFSLTSRDVRVCKECVVNMNALPNIAALVVLELSLAPSQEGSEDEFDEEERRVRVERTTTWINAHFGDGKVFQNGRDGIKGMM